MHPESSSARSALSGSPPAGRKTTLGALVSDEKPVSDELRVESAEQRAPARRPRLRRGGARSVAEPPTRSEFLLACVVALVLSACAIFGPFGSPARDSSSASAGAVVARSIASEPVARFTIEELAARRLPTWNPDFATGVPWLANPRMGVLDPEVWILAGLESIGGRALSDRGARWLAWLRLGMAAFGAYVLARRFGLRSSGAAVAAVGFAGSGTCFGLVDANAGHVVFCLPWLFVALDRLRDVTSLRSIAWVGLATALVVLGGEPEVAFCAGLAAFVFTVLTLEGRARTFGIAGLVLGTLCCAPLLVPFVEYLRHSEALASRSADSALRTDFDFLALGLVVVTVAIVLAWRGLDARSQGPLQGTVGMSGVVLAVTTCACVLADRGPSHFGRALVLFDAQRTGSEGAESATFAYSASAWVAAVVFALSIASFFAHAGPLRRRGVVQGLALLALLLAIGAPGVAHLWRLVPFFGLASTSGAACVAALCLSLLAGEALDAAPRGARRAAALAFVALVSIALLARPHAPPAYAADPPEEYFACTSRPELVWTAGGASIAGFVAVALPCDELVLRCERLDDRGRVERANVKSMPLALQPADANGKRAFKSETLALEDFAPGTWRFALDVFVRGSDGQLARTGSRDVAYSHVAPALQMTPASMAMTMLAFLVVLFLAGTRSRLAWLVVVLAIAHVALFAHDFRAPFVRAAEAGESETERIVRAEIGAGRVFTGRGVLPAGATFVSRCASVEGDDGLMLENCADFRREALPRGADALRDWHADEVDPSSAAFRLLGVSVIVTLDKSDVPGFDLIAGPSADCPRYAENFVLRARAPLPRAFTVNRVRSGRDLDDRADAFDPLHEARVERSVTWQPAHPYQTSSVKFARTENDHLSLDVTVDGDALLVLTDASHPGWKARVDGESARILDVDGLFRGLTLGSGAHRVEFDYEPASLAIGAWIGLAAFIALWILVIVPRRSSAPDEPLPAP